MSLYFPIAEMSLNVLLLLFMGGGVGFLSGMFGIGGGFLMTPLLIFTGVPPAVAVATEANQITASSVSGALAHFRRSGIDIKMGLVLMAGGAVGSYFGAEIFSYLNSIGQVDLMISLAYVFFLGAIGSLMLWENVSPWLARKSGRRVRRRRKRHPAWIHAWPHKMKFKKSHLVVSIYLPILIGFVVGVLAAIMGVGGGFVMIPALIYILGMPGNVVVGTSLFQIVFVTAMVTFFHSVNTQTVDVVMAMVLLSGGVIGAQLGARVGYKLKAEQFRTGLAVLVLVVCFKMGWDLFTTPAELYSVIEVAR
ncbi:MAG: sulfite exporter TauE/SafE family protein [Proteobacteria bacterium]|nr:sulfite exporter TauE/SafE family protein [Pseudomonadota bacterium]